MKFNFVVKIIFAINFLLLGKFWKLNKKGAIIQIYKNKNLLKTGLKLKWVKNYVTFKYFCKNKKKNKI